MSHWTTYIPFTILSVVLLIFGIVMFVSPGHAFTALGRLGGRRDVRPSDIRLSGSYAWQTRLAGFVMFGIGLRFIVVAISRMMDAGPGSVVTQMPRSPRGEADPNLEIIAMSFFLLISGLSLLIWPRRIVIWMIQRMVCLGARERILDAQLSARYVVWIRAIGFGLLIIAISYWISRLL